MNKGLISISLLLITVLLFAGLALAMESTNFAINWNVIGGGGGKMASASYNVNGTIGQAITGFSSSNGYQTGAGFWIGDAPPSSSLVHLPMVVR